jgi:HEPN domain-containing protein
VGVPRDQETKRFYRAAGQRLEDARFLTESTRTTAAVLLAEYCVECVLKALIITQLSPR